MRTPTRRALVAAFGLLVSPCSAWAQPANTLAQGLTDEDLLSRGIELRKQGRDAEALAAFERAYAQRPSPRAAAQIALAHHALARWREAERELAEALRNGDDPWVVRNRVYLEESLAVVQAHLAWLDVESDVAGAEVWMGGVLYGRLPLEGPLRIVAGEVVVEVRAPGRVAMERTLQVAAKSVAHAGFLFALEPTVQPPASGQGPVTSRAPVERPTSAPRTVGWITLAGAGALVLVGIGGVVTREWEAKIWNDDSQCAPLGQSRYARCRTNRDIGSAAQAIAIGAFVGAGIAGAVSGVLLFGNSRSVASPTMGQVGCRLVGSGIACSGTF
jgi:hypothetical protein